MLGGAFATQQNYSNCWLVFDICDARDKRGPKRARSQRGSEAERYCFARDPRLGASTSKLSMFAARAPKRVQNERKYCAVLEETVPFFQKWRKLRLRLHRRWCSIVSRLCARGARGLSAAFCCIFARRPKRAKQQWCFRRRSAGLFQPDKVQYRPVLRACASL